MIAATPQQMYDGVRAVLAEALGIEEGEIELASRLEEDLGVESLDMLEIGFLIEQKFGLKDCRLKREEVPTVELLVAYVESRLRPIG